MTSSEAAEAEVFWGVPCRQFPIGVPETNAWDGVPGVLHVGDNLEEWLDLKMSAGRFWSALH